MSVQERPTLLRGDNFVGVFNGQAHNREGKIWGAGQASIFNAEKYDNPEERRLVVGPFRFQTRVRLVADDERQINFHSFDQRAIILPLAYALVYPSEGVSYKLPFLEARVKPGSTPKINNHVLSEVVARAETSSSALVIVEGLTLEQIKQLGYLEAKFPHRIARQDHVRDEFDDFGTEIFSRLDKLGRLIS